MLRQPTPFFFEQGPQAVILLHAYSGSSNDVRLLARSLQRHNYTVYAPIFTGHATDDPRDILREGSPEQWWRDTQAAIKAVRAAGYQQIAVFGLSLGGIFATRALEVDRELVGGGVFSSPIITNQHTNVPQQFPRMARHVYRQQDLSEDQIKTRLAWIREQLPIQLGQINQFVTGVQANLNHVKSPFFIAQGGQDEMISAQSGLQLKQALEQTGQVVDYHFYETASHVLTVNTAHQQLETDVLSYLTTIFEVDNDN